MKPPRFSFALGILTGVCLILAPRPAAAHCDSMDGPVVKAAQQALVENNFNLVLIWVSQKDEPEVKAAFTKTVAVRKLNATARELADRYFFETLVRLHRAGEGEPYTGLKPAGSALSPAIAAADRAVETGDIKPLRGMLSEQLGRGLQTRFQAVQAARHYDKDDVKGGREWAQAYAGYMRYVEAIHSAAAGAASAHADFAVK